MIIKSLDISISSNVDKGIYLFEQQSSTGKTRLFQLLNTLRSRGLNVFGYTYDDYMKNISKDVIPGNVQLLLVDRYDMYIGKINEKIIEVFNNGGLVLLDSKQINTGLSRYISGEIEIRLVSAYTVELEV